MDILDYFLGINLLFLGILSPEMAAELHGHIIHKSFRQEINFMICFSHAAFITLMTLPLMTNTPQPPPTPLRAFPKKWREERDRERGRERERERARERGGR